MRLAVALTVLAATAGPSHAALPLATASPSTLGFLCFATQSAAQLNTACGPGYIANSATACAGSGVGTFYCTIFSQPTVLGGGGNCYDTQLHAAEGEFCPLASIQSDDIPPVTPQCGTITTPPSVYVWWCNATTPRVPAPPLPPQASPPPNLAPAPPVYAPFPVTCPPTSGTPGQCTCTQEVNVQFNATVLDWLVRYTADTSASASVSASDTSCDVCGKATYCPDNYDHINGWGFTSIDPAWFDCVSGGSTGSVGGPNATGGSISYSLCKVVPSTALLCVCIILPIALILLFLCLSCYLWPLCPIYRRRQRRKEKEERAKQEKGMVLSSTLSSEIRGIPAAMNMPLSAAQKTHPQTPPSRQGSLAKDLAAISSPGSFVVQGKPAY